MMVLMMISLLIVLGIEVSFMYLSLNKELQKYKRMLEESTITMEMDEE